MRLFKNKRGVVMLYISFIITAIMVVLIASVFAPMGVLFNEKMYEAGDMIMAQSQSSIDNINDVGIRNEINATIQSARDATQNNIEVNSDIFKYSWIFVLVVGMLVVFIYSRRLTEVNSGYI